MAMRKAITIYTDEGCCIDAVNVTWLVKRENSEENGVTMQNFRLKGNNAIYVPIKDADGVPVKVWKEDIALPSAQPEDYKELKREFLRMASYIDVLLECSDVQKETLMGFISRLAEFMPWTERD